MSLSLCFHYYSEDHRDLWCQLARMYDVADCYEIGLPSDVERGRWKAIDCLDHVRSQAPDSHVVFFSPKFSEHIPGQVSLQEFKHPVNAVYCFGSDEVHPKNEIIDQCVYIDTPRDVSMWSHQAATIVLHDRWMRRSNGDH